MSILNNINKINLLDSIFDYIRDSNFKFKLFNNSKLFQKKLNISLENYKEIFAKNCQIQIKKDLSACDYHLFFVDFNQEIYKYKFDKDQIDYIVNYKIKELENEVNKSEDILLTEDREYEISPIGYTRKYFGRIIKSETLQKICTIRIIGNKELSDYVSDYKLIFDKLNKNNVNYCSIKFYLNKDSDIDYINNLLIDFSKIKRLTLSKFEKIDNFSNIYSKLLQYQIFNLNLVFLKVNLKANIDSTFIENINRLQQLKYLYLYNLKSNKISTIKLKNLIKLYLITCDNITLSQESCQNLKAYSNSSNTNCDNSLNSLLKFPNVVDFTYTRDFPNELDLASFKNLKKFYGSSDILLNLESPSLEVVRCSISKKSKDIDLLLTEKNIIEKYILFKNLKEVELKLEKIDEKAISQIKGKNYSLKKMKLNIYQGNENSNNLVNSLIKKFPNLENIDINIYIYIDSYYNNEILKIKEDPNSKIVKLEIHLTRFVNFEFNCTSFENLIELKIECYNHLINEQTFPILSNNCKILFKSLKVFTLSSLSESNKASIILFNLFGNIKCMPCLKSFCLIYRYKCTEEFYKNFIRKLLSLNLESILFTISRDSGKVFGFNYYSVDELKEIYPKLYPYKYKRLMIFRY